MGQEQVISTEILCSVTPKALHVLLTESVISSEFSGEYKVKYSLEQNALIF